MKPHFTVVGRTTSDRATILAVFDAGVREAEIRWTVGRHERRLVVATLPAPPFARAVFALTDLPAGATVRYAVAAGEEAEFRLLAEAGSPRVAVVSCNDISNRKIAPERRGLLWRTLAKLVADREIDLLLHMGDQIYADELPRGSLPSEGHLEAYRRHYVNTWSDPDVAAVLARCPSMMMWDDHEIYDGYGSHDRDGDAPARGRFSAAQTAFAEFQAPLNGPGFDSGNSFAWSFDHAGLGVLAIDGRTNRLWSAKKVMGPEQLASMANELERLKTRALRRLLVIVGTPPVFVPALLALRLSKLQIPSGGDDIRDGWLAANNRIECRTFLELLLRFSATSGIPVAIVGGDIHVATLGKIETTLKFEGQVVPPVIHQITSSGVARPPPGDVAALLLGLVAHGGEADLFERKVVGELVPIAGAPRGHHMLAKRNFARLELGDDALNVDFFADVDGDVVRLRQPALRP